MESLWSLVRQSEKAKKTSPEARKQQPAQKEEERCSSSSSSSTKHAEQDAKRLRLSMEQDEQDAKLPLPMTTKQLAKLQDQIGLNRKGEGN